MIAGYIASTFMTRILRFTLFQITDTVVFFVKTLTRFIQYICSTKDYMDQKVRVFKLYVLTVILSL